nr:hypothetical protein [uncultured bacterium]
MAFHPYPQLIQTLFNVYWFGPPFRVTETSTWPWVDHAGFASTPTDFRPIKTRFRYGSVFLTSPVRSNS